MFKALATRLLQHLIHQNDWARDILLPFSGQSVQFNVAVVHVNLSILENGSLAVAGESNAPNATINISPSVAMRLLAQDDNAKREVEIIGDTHLASELAKVFTNMRWDYADDLSRVIGDVPAQHITDFAQNAIETVQDTGVNLTDMLIEYWQEEKPMIAKKLSVEKFNVEVDTLRADVARLEKKLKKLFASLDS
jgi:ubiquinone biosynthesis accessory factor UbiJ